MPWWLLDVVSSKCSLSVLLLAMEMSRTTQTALALGLMTVIRKCLCICAYGACNTRGYYLRAAFTSLRTPDCAATIWGWRSFQRNMVCMQGVAANDETRFFSRDVVLGGKLLLWGEKMWRISQKQTKFVIVWGGNSKLGGGGGNFPKGPEKYSGWDRMCEKV